MLSDQDPTNSNAPTTAVPSSYVPPRPPPKRTLTPLKFVVRGVIGLGIAVGLYFFNSDRSPNHAGSKYTSGDMTWRSIEPKWSEMWGEHSLDMTVNPLTIRGSSETTFIISGALLRSLCGSVLTKLPDPPDGVTRQDIYRLGFRFFEPGGKAVSDIYPVQVQNGSCVAHDGQVIFDWSYPGHLTGWSPVRYEVPSNEKMTIFFGRRGEIKIPYDQVDLQLACEALFSESSDKMRDLLSNVKELEIRTVKGVVSPVFWAGAYQSQSFQIINGSCLPVGEVIDG